MGRLITLSSLSESQLKAVRDLEKKLNICLVAFSEIDTPVFSDLEPSQVEEVKKLEQDLGIRLLAYDASDKKAA